MALHIHNTASRRLEPFEPGDPARVTMYVCGLTVYNFAHVGNARPWVVFDVLARLLRRSYALVYAQNVTDVDDRINEAARAARLDIGAVTARYIQAFHEDMAALGVEAPDLEPRATEHIPQIVAFIERLIASGHAYAAQAHVLFSVESYADYGHLSGRTQEDMIAGARVEVAPYKRAPADFVLWKPSEPGIVGWESPWGRGRPGWHIECSTMVETHLGETIDIHGGGQDLVFPHHENEIAQSTCAHHGKPFSRYWVHNGLVHVESEKMSKSLGNTTLIRDLVARYPAEAVRLGLLTAHYRQPFDWTAQLLQEAQQKLDRLYGALRDAGIAGEPAAGTPGSAEPREVVAALEDDLNTPRALAELFTLARAANRSSDPGERLRIAESLRAGAGLLGLLRRDPLEWFAGAGAAAGDVDEAEIDALVARRDALREARQYADADKIRDQLGKRGIVIEDVSGGTRWRRVR